MDKKEETSSFEHLFIIGSFFVVLIAWLALILTELRIFYGTIILVFASILLILFVYVYKKQKMRADKLSKIDYFTITFILLFAIFNSIFAHETFFGGRDYGVYSNSAVYLSKHHSLVIQENMSNLNIGGYLNLVGDFFQPHFHFAYISWLAAHYSFFGITGLNWANFLPIIIGLLSLYFIGKRILNRKAGLITVLLFATSYPMLWFTRRTLTEIFSFGLIWLGILCFMEFYKTQNKFYIVPSILSFGLLLYTRFETLFIFASFLMILSFLYLKKKIFLDKWVFFLIFIIIAQFIFYSIFIQPVYNETFQRLWANFFGPEQKLAGIETLSKNTDLNNLIGYHIPLYIFKVLSAFNLYFFILFIPITILYLFKKNKLHIGKLIPFLILLPTFIFLYDASVSLDLPWFLRRFVPTILPCAFLYTGLFFSIFKKKYMLSIISILLITNLLISAPILFFSEKNGLLKQTEEISNLFSENDKIFVDTAALSTPFSGIADPLFFIFDRKTEYISEWMASSGQLKDGWINADLSNFDNIYLVSNSKRDWFFKYGYIPKNKTKIVSIKNVSYSYLKFEPVSHLTDIREPVATLEVEQVWDSITIYKIEK